MLIYLEWENHLNKERKTINNYTILLAISMSK